MAPPADLHTLNLRGCRANLQLLQARLPGIIRRLGIGLVIIDPHYKISAASGFEENSNDGQGELLGALETLCSCEGASVAIAHHYAKGNASQKEAIDRASGGGAFARWPDVFIGMTPHEEDDCMTLQFVLRAFATIPATVCRWEYPVWRMEPRLDPEDLRKPGRKSKGNAQQVAQACLPKGSTAGELQQATGMSRSVLFRYLKEGLQMGILRQTGQLYFTSQS